MKTKILAFLLACLFAFPLLSVEVFADYSTVSVGDFEFILFPDTRTASVTKYTGDSTTVIIPAYVNGYSVVSAKETAFVGNSTIVDLTLPSAFTKIANFKDMRKLCHVTFKSREIKEISQRAFSNCTSLRSVEFPEGIHDLVIREYAFYSCSNLINGFNVDISCIKPGAFSGCRSLSQITLGKNFSNFDYSLLAGCTGLNKITVNPENKKYYSVNGVLIEKVEYIDKGSHYYDGDTLLFCPANLGGKYRIPDTVGCIATGAFYFSQRTEIILSENTHHIESNAFSYCKSLKSVTVNSPYISVSPKAFSNCDLYNTVKYNFDAEMLIKSFPVSDTSKTKYEYFVTGCLRESDEMVFFVNNNTAKLYSYNGTEKNVVIPDTVDGYPVTEIMYKAFSSNLTATSVTIPDSVTRIMPRAFSSAYQLEEVNLGSGVTEVGYLAFANCKALRQVYIGKSLQSLNHNVFLDSSNLESVIISDENPYLSLVDGVVYDKEISTAYFCIPVNIGTVSIPDTVREIATGAFFNCKLLGGIKLSSSLETIGYKAFAGCNRFVEVAVPDTLKEIGAGAFLNCFSLIEFTLPEGILSINAGTFYNCNSLKVVHIPKSVTRIDENAFQYCNSITDVYYGSSSYNRSMLEIDGTGNEGLTSANVKWHYEESGNSVLGDINGDRKINPVDGNILICIIIGNINFSEADYLSADVNLDGKVNAADSYILKKMILGNY